jgi:hypothetical protein
VPTSLVPENVPGVIGPGLMVLVTTDMVGPIGSSWDFVIDLYTDSDFTQRSQTWTVPSAGSRGQSRRFVLDRTNAGFQDWAHDLVDGGQVYVRTRLVEGSTVHDSGTQTMTWDAKSAAWAFQVYAPPVQGGFNETDRQQLADTRNALRTSVTTTAGTVQTDLGALFNWTAPDFWGSGSLSGGVTCNRIDYDASLQNLFGVSLVIEEYPADLVLRTPDGGWSFADLAVMSFYRGGILQQRHGIHTLTHTVSPLPSTTWYGAVGVNAPIQPTDYHIVVDWLDGVCGNLLGFRSPF